MKVEICEYGIIRHISDEEVEVIMSSGIIKVHKHKVVKDSNVDIENEIKRMLWL